MHWLTAAKGKGFEKGGGGGGGSRMGQPVATGLLQRVEAAKWAIANTGCCQGPCCQRALLREGPAAKGPRCRRAILPAAKGL